MNIQPYLFFDGRADEAIEFYKKALDAKVEMLLRFKDGPPSQQPMPPGSENKIMHAAIHIGDSRILLSDGDCQQKTKFEGFGLAANGLTVEQTQRYFQALSEGGQVQMPLGKTFFSESFGMVRDKFGILWMVLAEK
jgi:PhnB protein